MLKHLNEIHVFKDNKHLHFQAGRTSKYTLGNVVRNLKCNHNVLHIQFMKVTQNYLFIKMMKK